MEVYVSTANRVNASVDGGHARSSPSQDADTYESCKEIGKAMSDNILRGINQRFDAFETKFQTLFEAQADFSKAWPARSELPASWTYIKGNSKPNAWSCKGMQASSKAKYFFGRLNIEIIGVKEGSEEGSPTEFVSRLIPELLVKEHF